MNNTFLKNFLKTLVVVCTILISSVSVFAQDNSDIAEEPLEGIEAILSFALLLIFILAPAFKRRERTTFIGSNNKFFTI